MQPAISVIVPVYKAEKYIQRCVESIISQTFTNFELILVNDGSPDNSGLICDEYSRKDPRIKVIHKENGGVASARQCGIDNASGEYTIHADPDDWMEPEELELLYKKACEKNADIVISDFWVDVEKEKSIYRHQAIYSESANIVLDQLLMHHLHGGLWNKLIRTSCYRNYGIGFVEGLNYCEDYLVCVKILMNNVKVAYIGKAFYHYDNITNDNSITRKYTIGTFKQRLFFIEELGKTLKGSHKAGLLKNRASVAKECLSHNIFTPKEYKSIYGGQKWQLIRYITGYKNKIKFLKATLL